MDFNLPVSDEIWQQLLVRDGFKCLHCNTMDELMPAHYKSRGSKEGTNDLENLMLLCFKCHRKQHDGVLKVKKIDGHFYFNNTLRSRKRDILKRTNGRDTTSSS